MKVHELLADPKNWTQGANHRTIDGNRMVKEDEVKDNPLAFCHCAVGALFLCYPDDEESVELRLQVVNAVIKRVGHYMMLSTYNDKATHVEVLSLFQELDL